MVGTMVHVFDTQVYLIRLVSTQIFNLTKISNQYQILHRCLFRKYNIFISGGFKLPQTRFEN